MLIQMEILEREISLRQQVYATLMQSLEQARISEVRDTPVITVLQEPYLPPGPDDRSLLLMLVIGIVAGGITGLGFAFVLDAIRRPDSGDAEREDVRQAWQALLRSLSLRGRAA